jgi:serine/threonine transporter
MNDFIKKWTESSLILKIFIGLILGVILGISVPQYEIIGLPGQLFVNALKAAAPILVFLLVCSALSNAGDEIGTKFKRIICLYLFASFLAALIGVIGSHIFPMSITLTDASSVSPPGGLSDVLTNMLLNIFANPLLSLTNGDYLGILFWAFVLGICLKKVGSESTKGLLSDFAEALTMVVVGIIQFAPIGIMSLVFTAVSQNGVNIFVQYGELIALLVGCMLFAIFVVYPMIVAVILRRNPYPLLFICLKESGITAFFTRSSAANIPINMLLCEKLGLDEDLYSISIPLGATINTGGAAITITIMTLAVCHTLGIGIDLPSALILCIVSTFAACGASGVVGGSLLLIPMACALFGIPNDVAMQAVAVGFIIGVIQDSFETALNSSGDPMFTAAVDYYDRAKKGKPVNYLGEFAKDNEE